MGFLLFIAALGAIALMQTTPESRAIARAGFKRKYGWITWTVLTVELIFLSFMFAGVPVK